jgi:hypothetical protein
MQVSVFLNFWIGSEGTPDGKHDEISMDQEVQYQFYGVIAPKGEAKSLQAQGTTNQNEAAELSLQQQPSSR